MPFPPAHPSLLRALAERGFTEPTPVQAAVLEPDATTRDLLVSAQTGSGKTVAYGLAIASTLLGEAARFEPRTLPQCLVVAPTRELALQVQGELAWLYAPAGAKIVSCVGGMDIRREQRNLSMGAHIVVGTPGRLCDHLERGNLDLSGLRAVVLDEADEMLDLGFREDLERLLDASPSERRTLLFSATIAKGIATLARRYQKSALRIATSSEHEPHGDIEHRAAMIAPHDREHAVVNLLRYFEVRGALVFCSTREAVRHLQGNLLERGFAVVALSGELSQADRTRALHALRDGRARVCVATDVAARGLDLPDLGLVIHADLPHDRQVMLHRSGRTGRAGRKGISVLLVPYPARRRAERLVEESGVDAVWSPPPSADAIRVKDQERLIKEIASIAEEPMEEDLAAARALLVERSPEQLAAALVRMQRRQLPSPEELVEVSRSPAGRGRDARPGDRPGPGRYDRDARPAHPGDRSGPRGPGPGSNGEGDGERGAPRGRGPSDTVWFRMSVGRDGDADPRWVLPLICRRGHVTKADIGKIRIYETETQFEIARDVVERFTASVGRADGKDKDIVIDAVPAGAPRPAGFASPRPSFGGPGKGGAGRPRPVHPARKHRK